VLISVTFQQQAVQQSGIRTVSQATLQPSPQSALQCETQAVQFKTLSPVTAPEGTPSQPLLSKTGPGGAELLTMPGLPVPTVR
jgi:hypothetical protein